MRKKIDLNLFILDKRNIDMIKIIFQQKEEYDGRVSSILIDLVMMKVKDRKTFSYV